MIYSSPPPPSPLNWSYDSGTCFRNITIYNWGWNFTMLLTKHVLAGGAVSALPSCVLCKIKAFLPFCSVYNSVVKFDFNWGGWQFIKWLLLETPPPPPPPECDLVHWRRAYIKINWALNIYFTPAHCRRLSPPGNDNVVNFLSRI